MNYYVWHDEGCCDNVTEYLSEARAIQQAFLAEGREAYITDENNQVMEDPLKLCLTLEVAYELNGESAEEMRFRLEAMCRHAIGEGMLTGGSDAEVDEYSITVSVEPPPLSEEALANFMLQRIESGSLPLEDIPTRLARYGLMKPSAFLTEMRERMENSANA